MQQSALTCSKVARYAGVEHEGRNALNIVLHKVPRFSWLVLFSFFSGGALSLQNTY